MGRPDVGTVCTVCTDTGQHSGIADTGNCRRYFIDFIRCSPFYP